MSTHSSASLHSRGSSVGTTKPRPGQTGSLYRGASTASGSQNAYSKGIQNGITPRGASLNEGPEQSSSTSSSNYFGATLPSASSSQPSMSVSTPSVNNSSSGASFRIGDVSSSGFASSITSSSNASSSSSSTSASLGLSSLLGVANPNPNAQYALNTIDAFRARVIIEDALARLELIGKLLADASRRRDVAESSEQHRSDIVNLMRNQRELERQFEALMAKRLELRGLSNKSRYNQNEAEIKETIQLLQQSSSNISVHLKDQPSHVGNVAKLQRGLAQLVSALQSTASELRHGQYDGLVQHILKREAEGRRLDDARVAMDERATARMQLQADIATAQSDFDRVIAEEDATIAKLAQQLKHLRKVTASQKKYEEDASIAHVESLRRVQEQKLAKLRTEIAQAEADIEVDQSVHKKTMDFLGRQKSLLDDMHSDWEAKLARDEAGRTAVLTDLTNLRNQEREKLMRMLKLWDGEQEEKAERLEAIKKRTIEADVRRNLEVKMDRAQRLIRFWWRVYKRKLAKQKKKKKKKTAAGAGAGDSSPGPANGGSR